MRSSRWPGAPVVLAWVLDPLVWLILHIALDQCAVEDCYPRHWWDTPLFLAEFVGDAVIATVAWLYWRRYRDRAVLCDVVAGRPGR